MYDPVTLTIVRQNYDDTSSLDDQHRNSGATTNQQQPSTTKARLKKSKSIRKCRPSSSSSLRSPRLAPKPEGGNAPSGPLYRRTPSVNILSSSDSKGRSSPSDQTLNYSPINVRKEAEELRSREQAVDHTPLHLAEGCDVSSCLEGRRHSRTLDPPVETDPPGGAKISSGPLATTLSSPPPPHAGGGSFVKSEVGKTHIVKWLKLSLFLLKYLVTDHNGRLV